MEMTAGDILRNTKKINIALDTYLNERLASTDLTAAQGNVLFFILEHSGVHSTRIHKQLGISRGTVSGLIKKLREKGFLTLRTAPEDERQKLIEPTDRALELKQTLDRLAARTETQIFDGFSPQEIEALLCFQMRILQNLNKEEHLDGNRSQSNTTI